jgi:hypothetical protein
MGTRYPDTRCPRCGGKILIDTDFHGWYEQCLQCAYTHDLELLNPEKKDPTQSELRLQEAPALCDVPMNTYR